MSRKFAIGLAIVGALVVAARLIGLFFSFQNTELKGWIHQKAARYPEALADAKRAGIFLTMKDLQKPLPPPEQNAALIYTEMKALAERKSDKSEEATLVDLLKHYIWSPQDVETVSGTLHRHADFLRLAHEAASRSQCVFKRDWDNPNPLNIRFPENATIRSAARFLTAESLLMANQENLQQAVRNQALGFRMARHAATDGAGISHLVALAIDAITVDGMVKILYVSKGDAAAARSVEEAIAREWQPHSLTDTLKTEVAFQDGIMAMVRRDGFKALGKLTDDKQMAGTGQTLDLLMRLDGGWNSSIVDANHAYMLNQMQRIVAAGKLPYPQARQEIEKVDSDLDNAEHKPLAERLPRALAAIIFPDLKSLFIKDTSIHARMGVVRAGAAVLAYRGRHNGSLPGSLSDAMPVVPSDPFDEQPLRYRKEAGSPDAFVIYSVGPDGNYDGHIQTDAEKKQGVPASVFRFPPVQ